MNLAELRATLTEWLTELEPWRGILEQGPENYILTDEEYGRYLYSGSPPVKWAVEPNVLHVLLFTERNVYRISARLHEDREPYLGCISDTRYHRVGETWTRGHDLHDGPFLRETWDAIMRDILRYEFQAMTKDAIGRIKDIPRQPVAESGTV